MQYATSLRLYFSEIEQNIAEDTNWGSEAEREDKGKSEGEDMSEGDGKSESEDEGERVRV